ncbi:MAG: efflux RND transporter periplasmic adaptor subunit [Deltaproteobacteria bacterium]|nr:efflux RND transporter periplasmic adaptor subunit [Deltaproteobacteria bacterium]
MKERKEIFMFFRKTLLILFAFAFLLGCGKTEEPKQEAGHGTDKHTEEKGHQDEHTGVITLSPEAIEHAGIKTEAISLRPISVEYAFTGKVSVNETRLAHVGPRIPGRAVEVFANPGDYVKKGQPLAIIDSPELGEAQSQYLKAKTAFEIAEKSFERAKIVLEGKVISTGEFQRREGEYLSAKTELKAADDKLHLLGMMEKEIAAIGKEHTINSRVAIYSPISGAVIERHLTLGEVVEPVKPLFTVADLSNLWVIADVTEVDIPKIKKKQNVAIVVSAYPEKVFNGKLSYISEVIDPETRSVKVRAEVDNAKGMLKPEMFATVRISTSEREKVLAVPESAVQRDGDKSIVFVAIDEHEFEKRVIEVGPRIDGLHRILSGIKEGEKIVVKGAFTLKSEGQKGELAEHEH